MGEVNRSRHARRRWAKISVALLGLCAMVFVATVVARKRNAPPPLIAEALLRSGQIVVGDELDISSFPSIDGTQLLPLHRVAPDARRALRGADGKMASRMLRAAHVDGVLLHPRNAAHASDVLSQLQGLSFVDGFRAAAITTRLSFYRAVTEPELSPVLSDALVTVARGLLGGARTPKLASFPVLLREARSVEVMVMLSSNGQARLWRSARGSSIARAVITASEVARDRWAERQSAMGGSLPRALPKLDVEVELLEQDGFVDANEPGLIERAITSQHGIAYEYGGGWRYTLPHMVRAAGSPRVALQELLEENGLDEGVVERADFRVYRFVVKTLAVSRAPEQLQHDGMATDGLSDVQNPDELIKTAQPSASD